MGESLWRNGKGARLKPRRLLRSLLDKYSCKRYKTPHSSKYELNIIIDVLLER